jgi:branched-chain amino acid transport system ATP-binding protein
VSATLLQISDVHTYYGDAHILDGVTLDVLKNACVAVLGRNGVGKTTLARTLIGFTPPKCGQVIFRGVNIAGRPSREIVKLGLAIVPQGRRIFRSLSVEENLRIAKREDVISDDAVRWDLDRVYTLFPRLRERYRQPAGTLSGGEQQMLAIGRALMTCPTLLVLDEPTEGLAPIVIELVVNALADLKRTGVSLLLLEQRVEVALRLADIAVAMTSHGRITYAGPPDGFPVNAIAAVPISA